MEGFARQRTTETCDARARAASRPAIPNRTTGPVFSRYHRCRILQPSREAHSPIANLFRCYFAILITGADAVLVADAARPCVVQP